MSKARELSELGDKITVDGSGNSTFDGDVAAANLGTTGNITVTGTVDGRDVAADGTKLDGIEAGADVTDATNVTAAGALMDSEVTNLAAVKAFDPTDYATAAQGTLADSAVQPNDSPTFAGLTVDTNTLYVDSTNNRVGIGTISPSGKLDLGATTGVKLTLYPTNYSIGVESNELRIATNQNTTFYSGGHSGTERMRLDASGNLLVGTTVTPVNLLTATSGGGMGFDPTDNYLVVARDGTNSTKPALRLNQTGVDGDIVEFRKDGSTVGQIGTTGSKLYIENGDTGLRFEGANNTIQPSGTNGGNRDAVTDLGTSSNRFKDLYLSGTVNVTTVDLGNWTITESGGSLYFAINGTNMMKLNSSGTLDVAGDVNTNATIT